MFTAFAARVVMEVRQPPLQAVSPRPWRQVELLGRTLAGAAPQAAQRQFHVVPELR